MMQEWLQGALTLSSSPLALAACIAAVLAAAPVMRWLACSGIVTVGALLSSVPTPPAFLGTSALVVIAALGLLAVLRRRVSAPLAGVLAALGGVAAGSSAGFPWATSVELAGGASLVFLGTALVSLVVQRALQRFHSIADVGFAIVGAWIAALALLMLVLALRQQ